MTTKVKAVFKSKDGSEHATAAAAERQNKVAEAIENFKEAAGKVCSRLKEAAMTADGIPFAPGHIDYWYVTPSYHYCGIPELRKVMIFPYHVGIDEDEDGALLVYQNKWDRRSDRR